MDTPGYWPTALPGFSSLVKVRSRQKFSFSFEVLSMDTKDATLCRADLHFKLFLLNMKRGPHLSKCSELYFKDDYKFSGPSLLYNNCFNSGWQEFKDSIPPNKNMIKYHILLSRCLGGHTWFHWLCDESVPDAVNLGAFPYRRWDWESPTTSSLAFLQM